MSQKKHLTIHEIINIAKLAALPLTEKEGEKYATELSSILSYVDQLQEIETAEKPTSHPGGLVSRLDGDVPRPSLSQEEATTSAPKTKNGFIVVKGVFGED